MEQLLNLLVIDDEQVILDSIIKHLRKENYSIRTVLTAKEGLQIIENEPPDIILTDLMMPEIDGLELMKIVKDKAPQIPMIMITGFATINTALQATKLGAFDYIAKPFSRTQIKTVVRRAAEIAIKSGANKEEAKADAREKDLPVEKSLKNVGDHAWILLEKDGCIRMGVNRSFLHAIGKIQNVFLPTIGDELRQGSVYLQLFSSDLRSHTVLSPLSGTVLEINEDIQNEPTKLIEDPFGDGWLVRLRPSKLDFEIKELEL